MNRLYDAIRFADRHHKGQKRKATGLPYITHPIAVSYLLAQYKVSKHLEDLLIACILHDTVEDTSASHAEILRRFGPLVASLVHELTNDQVMIKKMGKLEYHKAKLVGISSYALVCKLVDRLHNIMDHPTAKMVEETVDLMIHLKSKRRLTKTQVKIVERIEMECSARGIGPAAPAAS